MRTAAIVLSTVVFTSLALSQISITSSDGQSFFATGKSWRHLANSNLSMTMNAGTASSSAQTWTLPAITYTDSARMDNLLPSATPYASNFPWATHAQRMIQSSGGSTSTDYQYFRITTDSVLALGDALRIQGGGADNTTITHRMNLQMMLPFTYGKSFASRDSTPIGPGSHIIQSSIDVCDAFGTIVMPAGTFQAVRKNQTVINRTFFGSVQVSVDTFVQFSFMTKEGYFADIVPKAKNIIGGTIPIASISYSTVITTPVGIKAQGATLPSEPFLGQNYPNPFNPTTAISYQLSSTAPVTLKVYDVLGKEVATLAEGVQSAGVHKTRFDGSLLRSGVYFYRIQAGSFSDTKKLILIK